MKAERGQTSFDFLVGTSVFLLTLGLVLGSLSGMVDPFVGGQENTLVADRITTLLAGGLLTGPATTSELNRTCTFGFFNESYDSNNGTACSVGFLANESDLADRLDIADRHSINVTIQRSTSDGELTVRCTDGDTVVSCPAETRLAAGPAPPSKRSVVSARRTVFLGGKDVVLEVRVW